MLNIPLEQQKQVESTLRNPSYIPHEIKTIYVPDNYMPSGFALNVFLYMLVLFPAAAALSGLMFAVVGLFGLITIVFLLGLLISIGNVLAWPLYPGIMYGSIFLPSRMKRLGARNPKRAATISALLLYIVTFIWLIVGLIVLLISHPYRISGQNIYAFYSLAFLLIAFLSLWGPFVLRILLPDEILKQMYSRIDKKYMKSVFSKKLGIYNYKNLVQFVSEWNLEELSKVLAEYPVDKDYALFDFYTADFSDGYILITMKGKYNSGEVKDKLVFMVELDQEQTRSIAKVLEINPTIAENFRSEGVIL